MLKNIRKNQRGISVIEVLVGFVIGVVIVSAIVGLFSTTITGSQQVLLKGKLDKELNATLDMIVTDVQRAGYWANATTSQTNPFTVTGSSDITVNASNNCFTFTYDITGSGTVSTANEFGYGLNTATNTIMARPLTAGADFSCATKSGWVALTDSSVIQVTAFTVTLNTVPISPTGGTDTTSYRTLTLTITGNLTNDSTLTATVTRTIKLYNNKYTP